MAISDSAQGDLQCEFLLAALRRVRQGLEQLQPFGEVSDCFHMSRTPARSLPCALPVGDGLRDKARLGVVMGQQFRLGLLSFRKSFLQHLGNPRVILLPFALQYRVIGRLLNQSMFEEVPGLWRQSSLVEQFGFHELRQPSLEVACSPGQTASSNS